MKRVLRTNLSKGRNKFLFGEKLVFSLCLVVVFTFSQISTFAQFTVDGQLIQRAEYRNGYGTLINEDSDPATFIGQRTRINANYKVDDFSFFVSAQDIRTWGNTSQSNVSDNFLSIHEAWGEYSFNKEWAIKLGRQELSMDNLRFLGNLDWALQARSHDLALLKFKGENSNFQLGLAYNQDGQSLAENVFNVNNQYKTAQLIRYEQNIDNFDFSVMLWNDGRQSADKKQTNFRQTIGIPTLRYNTGDLTISAFYYQQLGKDADYNKVSAFDASVQLNYNVFANKENGQSFKLALGGELLSGRKGNSSTENTAYSPLYGTNHSFNGYMDLFYAGGQHENSVGLQDLYLKARYNFDSSVFLQLDAHHFSSQVDIVDFQGNPVKDSNGEVYKNYLGAELDLSLGYIISNSFSLQAGYSQFFQSSTMELIRQQAKPASMQNWAYLMLIFRPTSSNKFSGILF